MIELTATAGPAKASTWPVDTKQLVVGRGRDCDIYIGSPTVSRHQCRIETDGRTIHLCHLSDRVPTLVNGESVSSATLAIGDEITIGESAFLVTSTGPAIPRVARNLAEGETETIALSDALFVRKNNDSVAINGHPRFTEQLFALYQLGRKMCEATSAEALERTLRDHVDATYRSAGFFIATCGFDAKVPRLHFIGDDPAEDRSTITDLMNEAVSRGEGISRVGKRRKEGQGSIVSSSLAVPMVVRGEAVGALSIETVGPVPLTHDDLEYFIGVAHEAASMFMLMQLLDQREKDIEVLRAKAGESTVLVGESEPMKQVRSSIRKAAPTDLSVLVQGETGTGKELAAQLIHDFSRRSDGPFITVNCAAIPSELFESEFFGHEKGAFTGADRRKTGHVERAHRGSLFLDEVGDLSPANQARLLRVIEEGTFRRIGGEKEICVDVRVLSATNKDLPEEVKKGQFRDDLLHRLNAFEIDLPNLRDRPSDIAPLAEHFFQLGIGQASRPLMGFEQEALDYLKTRPWSGNVRQLRNAVFRAIALAQQDQIGLEDVRLPREESNGLPVDEDPVTLAEMEKDYILQVLAHVKGNISAAARVLDVSRHKLYRKLEAYGIPR